MAPQHRSSLDDPNELTGLVMDIDTEAVVLHGIDVPRHFRIYLNHPSWIAPIVLSVTVDPDRGPIASGIDNSRWGDEDASRTDVQTYRELDSILASTIELPRILQRMTAEAAGVLHQRRMEQVIVDDYDNYTPAEIDQRVNVIRGESRLIADAAADVTLPRRRRIVSRKHLIEVAAAYREALDRGLPPTQHVADRFHASHSTASRWVGMAREAGELGGAMGTKPGEIKP